MGSSTALFFMIVPLFYASDIRPLPLMMWSPIAVNKNNYWYFFIYQSPAIVFGGLCAAASDIFIFWLFYQINIQFDIVKDRMKKLPDAATVFKKDKQLKRNFEHRVILENIQHTMEITV